MTPFFIDRSELGMLKLTGKTRIDLLHRMSTQDLRNMRSGEGRATVLTTGVKFPLSYYVLLIVALHR